MKHKGSPPSVAPPHDAPGPEANKVLSRQMRSSSGRTKLKEREKIKVWVRAGGTCVLCKRYLLEGAPTGLEVSLGELAHIVGQRVSVRSPRGVHPMPKEDRDSADNVLLACEGCHEEIDDQLATGILDVDALGEMKARHEQRVRHVTTLPDDRRSLVLRVVSQLRGNAIEVTRATAATTVIESGRFPWFDLDRDRLGVEIDLRSLPGEVDADVTYYAMACRVIDEVMDTKVRDAIKSGDVRHISVFPFARFPLLVYLGFKLEDNCTADVYQRHRATQDWSWDELADVSTFTATHEDSIEVAAEAVLVLHVSGSVATADLPTDLSRLPRLDVRPDATPSPDVIRSRPSLDAFSGAIRQVNALLDIHKNIRRLHVFGALPPTAAVEFGRLHDPHIHPTLIIYDRGNDGGYRHALEIGS